MRIPRDCGKRRPASWPGGSGEFGLRIKTCVYPATFPCWPWRWRPSRCGQKADRSDSVEVWDCRWLHVGDRPAQPDSTRSFQASPVHWIDSNRQDGVIVQLPSAVMSTIAGVSIAFVPE